MKSHLAGLQPYYLRLWVYGLCLHNCLLLGPDTKRPRPWPPLTNITFHCSCLCMCLREILCVWEREGEGRLCVCVCVPLSAHYLLATSFSHWAGSSPSVRIRQASPFIDPTYWVHPEAWTGANHNRWGGSSVSVSLCTLNGFSFIHSPVSEGGSAQRCYDIILILALFFAPRSTDNSVGMIITPALR